MSTFQGLEIAKSGMMTYNASMQTAAHNLANIGTKGYSRQIVKTSAQTRNVSAIKVMGAGVYTQGIMRVHNDYYDTKYERANATYSKYSTHAYYLNDVQTYLYSEDEKDGGITTAFDAFCKCLTGTTGNAGDETRRKEIITYADTFTSFVQEAASNLQALQEEANEEIKTTVDQINALADKIASITKQINTLEAYSNDPANDLRDQRTVLLDELSTYCNIEVLEKEPADGVGLNQYYVYVDGSILIDTYNVNQLVLKESDTKKTMNDISGLYEVAWMDGTPFHAYSSSLGGKLQALFEVRDGNNATTLTGAAKSLTNNAEGNLVVTMQGSITDTNLLNIPAEDGELTINGFTYAYDSFEVKVGEDGTYTYEFTLKNEVSAKQATVLERSVKSGFTITIGDKVDYKGVPYYMAQLNEFVRTYAQAYNDVHKSGYDNYGNQGIDFFNATVAATGDNYIFSSKNENGYDRSFSSLAKPDENGSYTGSYYYMTALNICVTDAVKADPQLLAHNEASLPGVSENLNLQKLANLKDNSKMFLHGSPDSFLQSFTADVGVDAKKALTMEASQKNIRDAVDIQRQSISGADEDEEAEDLITFQNMLFNQYKVLSVMNEVLDKLINQTAV